MRIDIRDVDFKQMISLPGAIPLVILLSIILPTLGLIPSTISSMIFITFAIPILYTFFIKVILNREIKHRKGTLPIFGFSYVIVLLTTFWGFPPNALSFYIVSIFFLFAAGFSIITYTTYYLLFRIIDMDRFRVDDFRKLFIAVFIPSVVVTMIIAFILNLFLGEFLFGLDKMLMEVL